MLNYDEAKREAFKAALVPKLVATLTNKAGEQYDFYVQDTQGKPFYNLLPHGQAIADGGYFDLLYVFKVKGF